MKDVEVKKNLIIFKNPDRWLQIRDRMIEEYGKTNIIISWRLRKEFGFTIREHRGLAQHSSKDLEQLEGDWQWKYYYQDQIHLDFFNDSSQSWFQLKYL